MGELQANRRRRWVLLDVTDDEDVWRSWAASLAIGSFMLVAVAVIWISWAESEPEMATRVRILSPFGVIYVALITFCTVVWRGLISARQANYQQKQLDSLAKQIAATEENNLAGLLQKGAELLADLNSRAHLGAGIASLQAVITAENDKFVREAMELIADFIDEKFQHSNHEPLFRSAAKALEAGAARGYIASRILDFTADETTIGPWVPFPGVEHLWYINGEIRNFDDAYAEKLGISIECQTLQVTNSSINRLDDSRFFACTFNHCDIRQIALTKNGVATLNRCDLSGATLDGSIVADINFQNCYYRRENPPLDFPPEWMERLTILS